MSKPTNEKVQFTNITPKLAKEYLLKNKRNRKLSLRKVRQYVRAMKEKKWIQTGDSIRFDIDGNLIDGQHKLHAIIESNTTQKMVVVTGLPAKAIYYIDTGKIRTQSDAFGIAGIDNPTVFSETVKFLDVWMRGYAEPKDLPKDENAKQKIYEESIDFFNQNSTELRGIYARANKFNPCINKLLPMQAIVAMIFFVKSVDKDADDYIFDFFQDLLEATSNRATKIPELLRKKLDRARKSQHRLKTGTRNLLLLNSILIYRKDKTYKSLPNPKVDIFKKFLEGDIN